MDSPTFADLWQQFQELDVEQRLTGPNTDIRVDDPTFSCFAGDPTCDAVIEESQ